MTDSSESLGSALSEEALQAIIKDHRLFLSTNGAKLDPDVREAVEKAKPELL